MNLKILDGSFCVCKVQSASDIPWEETDVFAAKTETECSLVCRESVAPDHCLEKEPGWRCFRIEGPLDFSLVGILARISGVLAEAQIPLFAVSTFDTDYILVRSERFAEAKAVLEKNGDRFL